MGSSAISDSGAVAAEIDVQRDGATARLVLSGTFTEATHERLKELLDWLISQGNHNLHVDLGTTIGIDWACLSLLRATRERLRRADGQFSVGARRAEVANELMLTGLDGSGLPTATK